jgi:hypothetical protein
VLPPAIAEMMKQFCVSDQISRIMAEKRIMFLLIQKTHIHKQLILCNLKEAYFSFKEQNPEKLLGFPKFAELQPKNCVLAEASGTHAICVYHSSECETCDLRCKIS